MNTFGKRVLSAVPDARFAEHQEQHGQQHIKCSPKSTFAARKDEL